MDGKTTGPKAKLGLFAAIALIMGNMIGSGVFLLPASLAPYGWNGVIGWIVTIAGTLVLALVFAQLTRALPHADDTVSFVTIGFGELPSFVIGWSYLVSIWVGIAAIAVAGISYLSSLVPAIANVAYGPALATLALIWSVTAINLRGVRSAGNFQILTLAIKLIPLLLVIILAAIALLNGSAQIAHFEPASIKSTSVNAAASLTLWALLGFEAASVVARRVRNPEVNVPRATIWGAGMAGLLYLLVCSAIALLLPQEIISNSPAPFATFVAHLWRPEVAAFIAAFAVVSCVGAVNGWVLVQGEMPRAMAERGLMPAWFAQTEESGASRRNLVIGSTIASVFVLFAASRSMQGMFEFLLLLGTCAALWLYLVCALVALKLRIATALAAIGAAYAVWTLWGAGLEALFLSIALMFAGLPIWWWMRRLDRVIEPV